jgi:hypothetical protein
MNSNKRLFIAVVVALIAGIGIGNVNFGDVKRQAIAFYKGLSDTNRKTVETPVRSGGTDRYAHHKQTKGVPSATVPQNAASIKVKPTTDPAKWLEMDPTGAHPELLPYSFNSNSYPQTDADNGIYRQGINIDAAGNRVNNNEVAYSKEQELNYLTNGKRYFEWHETFYDTDGSGARLMTSAYERGALHSTLAFSMRSQVYSFSEGDDTLRLKMDWPNNRISLPKTTIIRFGQPQTNLFSVTTNAGGTAQLMGLNASDELYLGGTGTAGVALGAELRLNGGQNYIKPANNNEAITLGKAGALANKVVINASGSEILALKNPDGGHFKFIVDNTKFQIRDDGHKFKVPLQLAADAPHQAIILRRNGGVGFGSTHPEAGVHISTAANGGGLAMEERAAPAKPSNGIGFIYVDSATGDLMYKIQHGGVVKTGTLADFSALQEK